jgi:2-methylcitrate dehydratase
LNPTSRRVLDDPQAATAGKAAFSAQYLLATAIAHKHIGLDTFEERSLADPLVRNVMKRVTVTEDPAYLATFPQTWTTEISIETIDGRELRKRAELPEGDPANPLPAGRLEAKCRDLLSKVMRPAQANNVIERLSAIDSIADTRLLLPEIADTALVRQASKPRKARAAIGG